MNAVLLVMLGAVLALEALPPRYAGRLRSGLGLLLCAAVAVAALPPHGLAGASLIVGVLLWMAVAGLRHGRSTTTRRPRTILALLLVAGVGSATWGAASLAVAHHLVSRRQAPFAELPPSIPGLAIEELRLHTEDRLELGAWWVEGAPGRDTVIVLHGNKSSRSRYPPYLRFFADRGHSVLIPSLRAHGDSEGELHDYGWSARHDVRAAVEEARRRRPDDRVLILGRSLGAAAALYAAEQLEAVDGWFLEAPFRDLPTATRDRIDRSLPAPLAWLAVQSLAAAADLWIPGLDRHRPGDRLPSIPARARVMLLFGRTDRQAPRERFDELVLRRPGTEVETLDLGGHRPMLPRDREGWAAVWERWHARF